eukprot:1758655-Lingulodinium_polyedra.AAC.1
MTEFELLRVLVSLRVWGSRLQEWGTGGFRIEADSASALAIALKLASPKPVLNALAAEIVLTLEACKIEVLVGTHYRGTLNVLADALSRLAEGAEVPRALRGVPR